MCCAVKKAETEKDGCRGGGGERLAVLTQPQAREEEQGRGGIKKGIKKKVQLLIQNV